MEARGRGHCLSFLFWFCVCVGMDALGLEPMASGSLGKGSTSE